MTPDPPTWLFHNVPLWAFLLALLTSPAKWSKKATAFLSKFRPGS